MPGRGGEGKGGDDGIEELYNIGVTAKYVSTHHCENGSWFLDPQCLHHLEHIHHSLRLAALDGGGNGTEHTRAANSITGQCDKNSLVS